VYRGDRGGCLPPQAFSTILGVLAEEGTQTPKESDTSSKKKSSAAVKNLGLVAVALVILGLMAAVAGPENISVLFQ
tara:strand:+ start:1283 stop:1510 length:228 start_codon:yes stop_codon:yes gene_type:complete